LDETRVRFSERQSMEVRVSEKFAVVLVMSFSN